MIKISKSLKIALFITGIGLILLAIGFFSGGFKPISISSHGLQIGNKKEDIIKLQENLNSFENIDINVENLNIEIIKDDSFSIEGEYDKNYDDIIYSVENNTLKIKSKEKRNNSHFFIFFGSDSKADSPKIKIHLPEKADLSEIKGTVELGNLKLDSLNSKNIDLKCNYGNIDFNNLNSENITVNSESGTITYNNINCNNIKTNSNYGDVTVNSLKAINSDFNLESGNFKADNLESDKITGKNSYGNIEGNAFKTNGIDFQVESGTVNLKGELKGENKIKSEYGDININSSLAEKDYSYDTKLEMGSFKINNVKMNNQYKKVDASAPNSFIINNENGNLTINFAN